jgi:phosphate transport system substrate-binding protein
MANRTSLSCARSLRVSHTIMRDEAFENMSGTKNMLQLMSRSDRLSTTIRFDNGSTDLDTTDYEDLEELAKLIRSPMYEGSYFYFMGFSDSIGSADLNQFLALQRAEVVRQALVSRYPELADRVGARSIGYGELSPLACNETRPGRNINRRVEVWVQDPMTTLDEPKIY